MLDADALLRRCFGKVSLAEKLVGKLLARLDGDLGEIGAALDDGSCERLASLAHKLKGAAANLAAEPIRRNAAEIEARARSADLEGARGSLAGLEREVKRFLAADVPASIRAFAKAGDDAARDPTRETVDASADCR